MAMLQSLISEMLPSNNRSHDPEAPPTDWGRTLCWPCAEGADDSAQRPRRWGGNSGGSWWTSLSQAHSPARRKQRRRLKVDFINDCRNNPCKTWCRKSLWELTDSHSNSTSPSHTPMQTVALFQQALIHHVWWHSTRDNALFSQSWTTAIVSRSACGRIPKPVPGYRSSMAQWRRPAHCRSGIWKEPIRKSHRSCVDYQLDMLQTPIHSSV